MEEDWKGDLYYVISLNWHYAERYVDTFMPHCVQNQLTKCRHELISKHKNSPYAPELVKYSRAAQDIAVKPERNPLGAKGKTYIQQGVKQLLYYMHSYFNTAVHVGASDIILNMYSSALCLTESRGRSRVNKHFFLGSIAQDSQLIQLNKTNITNIYAIIKLIAVSAVEVELGALFLNAQEAILIILTLVELGHPRPPTPMHIVCSTCMGICIGAIKQQR